jgi:hypothetical protein
VNFACAAKLAVDEDVYRTVYHARAGIRLHLVPPRSKNCQILVDGTDYYILAQKALSCPRPNVFHKRGSPRRTRQGARLATFCRALSSGLKSDEWKPPKLQIG